MKHFPILAPILLGVALLPQLAQARPAATAPKTKPAITASTLPAEVRAMMAPGATTVSVARLPFGTKGTPILLHAWTIKRRSPTTPSVNYVPALYCLDFFYKDSTTKKWELASSTSYLSEGSGYPGGITYEAHWLHPTTKQGVVIVETTSQETGGIVRLITFPTGIENESISWSSQPFVQEFYTSHSGGSESRFITFGVDKTRGMTVKEEILPHTVAPQIHNTYAWTGTRWTKVASQKTNQS